MRSKPKSRNPILEEAPTGYGDLLTDISRVIQDARRAVTRSVNTLMTMTYWLIGRRIVDHEQRGSSRAEYGEEVIERLSVDLQSRFGRGFGRRNLFQMRAFYLAYDEAAQPLPAFQDRARHHKIVQAPSAQLRTQTNLAAQPFSLPWSHDEYSESDLEAALISKLEAFLMELGSEFAVVGRQRRLRIGDEWYRVDLLVFHRRLRCLVVIDLKLGRFSHADAGQMHLYLNYAREHWTLPGESPPVGLILCAEKDHAVAKYSLDGLPNKVLASVYRMVLPTERLLVEEIERTRRRLETRIPPSAARRARCRVATGSRGKRAKPLRERLHKQPFRRG